MKKNLVIRSINNINESLCVDIFQREDKTFGFEEYRRDLENNDGWYKVGSFGEIVYANQDDAYKSAIKNVIWLNKVD